ncbi:MAG: helix-turn-helix domain-containing protein [Sediminicola sp.]
MKHISILVPEGNTSLSNLEATHKMFTMANGTLEKMGNDPLFEVHLVGLDKTTRSSYGIFGIIPDTIVEEVDKTDLIIIPAIHGDYAEVIAANQKFVPWIREQYKKGAEIASLCIGAFLLASTGLLKGKNCTTHWLAASEFRSLFPEVNLLDDRIITDENGIYTSGGAYSSLNLNLYLVEKFAGREMAVLSSKIFEIDINRNSQSPFIIFKGQKSHMDQDVLKAQEFMERNFREKISVDDLCDHVAASRRTFERRFKKATSNTVGEYLQRVKIEAAKKELEKGRMTVGEVMYEVGYSDPKAFRDVFRKITDMTPMDYLNRYSKSVPV